MELLTILLIFSLGVIMLIACFLGGIAFVIGQLKKFVTWVFSKKKD